MKVALGVTGCIAAYKSVEIMRGLQKAGVSVQVVLTRSARRFIAPLTFEALSGCQVISGMFRPGGNLAIEHIHLAQDIQLLAVVPATANILGKIRAGIADDMLSTVVMATAAPVLLAPAMELQPAGELGGAIGRLLGVSGVVIPKTAGSDVRDAEMRRLNPTMPGVPLGAIAELVRMQRHVAAILPEVEAPALVIQGAKDHTVTLAGALRLASAIGSGPARVVLLPESWHLVGIDVERDRCAEETERFIAATGAAEDGA